MGVDIAKLDSICYLVLCIENNRVSLNSLLLSWMLTVATADVEITVTVVSLAVRDTVKVSVSSTTLSVVVDISTVWGPLEPLLNVSVILVIAVKSFPAGKMEDWKVVKAQNSSTNGPLYGAAGSNLRMVKPSLMSVVKLLIICAQSAWQNLDLGIFSSEEALSLHLSFKLRV